MTDTIKLYSNGMLVEGGTTFLELDANELYEAIVAEVNQQHQLPNSKTLGYPELMKKDALDLSALRWGLVFPQLETKKDLDHQNALKQALEPLIKYRSNQMAGLHVHQLRYQQGWNLNEFLFNNAHLNINRPLKPDKIPYYLCLVGSPVQIPWSFQQELDATYAVGRLWFDDPQDCERYIQSLLHYEESKIVEAKKRAWLVAPKLKNDSFTSFSVEHLASPLVEALRINLPHIDSFLWVDEAATKKHLLSLIQETIPDVLMAISHGVEFSKPDPLQYNIQGAIVLQEAPNVYVETKPQYYLGATDIEQTSLNGMVMVALACCSAGTPLKPDWLPENLWDKLSGGHFRLAEYPFVAKLPQKVLSQGALGFIGHVSKTFYTTFYPEDNQEDNEHYLALLLSLLTNQPIGRALEAFSEAWKDSQLNLFKLITSKGKRDEVNRVWQTCNDLKGFVLLGDPFVQIRRVAQNLQVKSY